LHAFRRGHLRLEHLPRTARKNLTLNRTHLALELADAAFDVLRLYRSGHEGREADADQN
jgi:hypothetical protein